MPTHLHFVEPLAHGVYAVDTGFVRPRFDASHLVVESGRAAFVDTGTTHAVPRLLEALASLGVARDAVDYVIATHIHLDHSGGAGALLQHLPNARVVVHPLGTRHLVDPSRLMASARTVYGDAEVERNYGEVIPVPAERVIETNDGFALDWAGRRLRFFDTPGHARHHHCIWDERSRGVFTGDTLGIAYPEFTNAHGPWLIPSTPPTQFDPPALRASVQRVLALEPDRLYLTHYSELKCTAELGRALLRRIEQVVSLGETLRNAPDRPRALEQGLAALYRSWLLEHGCAMNLDAALELLEIDVTLNAQGMGLWLG